MGIKSTLKEYEIQLQDLAKALHCSRPTLDEYIRKYEEGDIQKMPQNIINVFEFIHKANYVSLDGIKVRYMGGDDSKPIGEDNPIKWETRSYITSDNISSLLKEIRKYHEVKKHKDGTYRFMKESGNVIVRFILADYKDYDKNQKLHIFIDNSIPVKSYQDILNVFKDVKEKAIFLYKQRVKDYDENIFPPEDLDEVIENDNFENHMNINEEEWSRFEEKKINLIHALNSSYLNSSYDLEKLNKMINLLSHKTSGFTVEWEGNILCVVKEYRTGKYYLCYIAELMDPTSPSEYKFAISLEGGSRELECRPLVDGEKELIEIAKYIESRAKYCMRRNK